MDPDWEPSACGCARILGLCQIIWHPELAELYLEPKRIRETLGKVVEDSSCCIDVGAHLGSFTAMLVQHSPRGRIAAFEASPTKCTWLRKKFPTVAIYECAVSNKVGVSQFCESARSGYSRLAGSQPLKDSVQYSVNTCRLDDVLGDFPRIDFIKLDIEGSELAALQGASNIIGRHRPMIMFECGSEYEPSLDRKELFELLLKFGYSVFTVSDFLFDKEPLSFVEFRKCGLYPFRAFNFIATPLAAT